MGNLRLYSTLCYTRDDIIDLVTNDIYTQMPIYITFKLIQKDHPTMSVDDILKKYFDPLRGHTFTINTSKIDQSEVRSVYYRDDTTEKYSLVFFIDKYKTNNYITYYEDDSVNADDIEYYINTPLMIGHGYIKKEYALKEVLHRLELANIVYPDQQDKILEDIITTVNVTDYLDLIFEYGYTKERLIRILKKHAQRVYFTYNGSIGHRPHEEKCCKVRLHDVHGRFCNRYDRCPFCKALVYWYPLLSDYNILDINLDSSPQICAGCKNQSKPVLSFIIDKNGDRVYCHRECVDIEPIRGFKTYNRNLIVNPELEKIFNLILEYDF